MESNKRIHELDGIRGIAILMIIVWHYYNCQTTGANAKPTVALFNQATSFLWSGVDLFFTLSGFLIGGILIERRNDPRFYSDFFIRRACRILPVYITLLLAFFVLRGALDPNRYYWLFHESMSDIAYLTFTQNILMGQSGTFGGHFLGITWSLSVEEQFYLAMPALLFLFGFKNWMKLLVALLFLAPVLRAAFPGFHTFVNTPFRMDSLLMGVTVALATRDPSISGFLKQYQRTIGLIALILFTGILASSIKGGLGFLSHTFYAVFYSCLILYAVTAKGESSTAFFRSATLRFFGRISYALYMFHQAVSGLLHGAILMSHPTFDNLESKQVTLLALATSIALATLSCYTLEKYFLNVGASAIAKRKLAVPHSGKT